MTPRLTTPSRSRTPSTGAESTPPAPATSTGAGGERTHTIGTHRLELDQDGITDLYYGSCACGSPWTVMSRARGVVRRRWATHVGRNT